LYLGTLIRCGFGWGHIARLVAAWRPDILCLQETKVEDASFPHDAIRQLGFAHRYISGQKSYNGVAILSNIPLTHIHFENFAGLDHRRHISATLPDGTSLHNFYIPAGGDIPDVDENPAYAAKLRFVEEMSDWALRAAKKKPAPDCGGGF
jgi:exodeoxyribonuclease-3